MDPSDALALLDWRRQVFALYERVRAQDDPRRAWELWRRRRDELFGGHRQSPLPPDHRERFGGLEYFAYDESYRVEGDVRQTEPTYVEIANSTAGAYRFTRFAEVTFVLDGATHSLELFWLEGYAGGVFLPIRDATSGHSTYGGGRYLLDTIKGADLGTIGDALVLDFNFAYNPSCSYDPRWACPLAPPANSLPIEIRAGERAA